MKFTNHPCLRSLKICKNGIVYEQIDLSKSEIKFFCRTHGLDPRDVLEAMERDHTVHTIVIDHELYHKSKENNMNSDKNIGDEIRLVVPSVPRVQSLQVTKDNIIMAAQWCGASVVYVPSGPDRWSFDNGKERVNVGDFLVRERDGKFVAMRPYDFHEKYDEA